MGDTDCDKWNQDVSYLLARSTVPGPPSLLLSTEIMAYRVGEEVVVLEVSIGSGYQVDLGPRSSTYLAQAAREMNQRVLPSHLNRL